MLDEARAAWKARIAAFEAERAKLETSNADAFLAAEQALLDKSFTPLEQRRVRATMAMREK
jgi:lipase chaperone LimK